MHNFGFLRIPRSLFCDSIWQTFSCEYRSIFITILMNCVWKETIQDDFGVKTILKPGQCLMTEKQIIEQAFPPTNDIKKLSKYKSACTRAMEKFEKYGFSNHKTNHKKRIHTMLREDILQAFEPNFELNANQARTKREPQKNNTISKEVKEEQQPPTPKGGFVVVDCLKGLELHKASIVSLQKAFSEDELSLAVRWCKEYESQGNIIDNLGGMIRYAATNQPEMPKPKKDLKKSLEFFKHGEKYNNAECWRDKESIGFTRGMKQQKVMYKSKTFFQDVKQMLESFQIEMEFEWEPKIISIG